MKTYIFTHILFMIGLFAVAQDRVSVADFSIQPGEISTLTIELVHENAYTAFQMDVVLPEGLTIVKTSNGDGGEMDDISFASNRSDASHIIASNEYENGVTRIVSYSNTKATFMGNQGPFLNIKVKAADDMALGAYEIKLMDVIFTEPSSMDHNFDNVVKTFELYQTYNISAKSNNENFGIILSQNCGENVRKGTHVTVSAQPNDGYEFVNWTVGDVAVSSENPYTFVAEADKILIANFTPIKYNVIFEIDSEQIKMTQDFGSVIFPPSEPTKEGYTFVGWNPDFVEGTTVPVGGMTYTAQWEVNTYQITYVVDGEVYQTDSIDYGEIISPIEVPTKDGYIFSDWSEIPKTMPAGDVTITGTFTYDYNLDAYKRLNAQIAELQTSFDSVKATIETECMDVAQDFAENIASIQKSIDVLKADVETKYKNAELTAESTINTSSIASAIEKLLADAKSAQKVYEDEQAKKSANEAAYTRLTKQIADVQTAFDAAKTTIDTDCKDVAEQFTEQLTNLQNRINELSADVKAKYDKAELTAESSVDTASITSAIETLLNDAKSAQKTYENEQAKIAANEAAYARLTEQIASVQSTFDTAKAAINTDCKDVAGQFTDRIADIQNSINSLSADVKAKYGSVSLTAESTIETATITATIEKLLADAKSAQTAYEAEQAKIAANEVAYTHLTEQIADVQKSLDVAKATINTDCKDVASQFTEQIAGIQERIIALSADVKAKYESVSLTAESTVDTSGISSAIEELISAAKSAQELFEAGEAAKLANEVAYARLTEQIAGAQAALDAAKATIISDCKNVAGQFTDRIAGIQNNINSLSTDIKAKYDKTELTAESTVDTATIAAAIETLLNDAKSAQAAYEAEQTKIAANEAAYVRLTEQISELQANLDAATDSIHANCKDVASQFVEQIDSLQNVINAMSADIKVKYDNVELTTESVVDITSLSDAIVELLTNAEKAQKEYEEALSIGSVDTEEKVIEIYSLTGKKVSKTQKGLIYLFRYENGKTVKKLAK